MPPTFAYWCRTPAPCKVTKSYLQPHDVSCWGVLSLNTSGTHCWSSPSKPGHLHLLLEIFIISIMALRKSKCVCVFWSLKYCKNYIVFPAEVETSLNHSFLDYDLWCNKNFRALLFLLILLSKRSLWGYIRVWIFMTGKAMSSQCKSAILKVNSWHGMGTDQSEHWLIQCRVQTDWKVAWPTTRLNGSHTFWQSFCPNPYVNHLLAVQTHQFARYAKTCLIPVVDRVHPKLWLSYIWM